MTRPALTRATSADGTPIGVWTSGSGPPLVMLHGTSADHLSWEMLRPSLEQTFTVHAVDRRGRLASGDHPEYAVDREVEDVAAVVDHVAATSDSAVTVFGHSFGGAIALMAAARPAAFDRVVAYEPPLTSDEAVLGTDIGERLQRLADTGDGGAVLAEFYREVVGLDEAAIGMFRTTPTWASRAAAAHTLIREFSADFALDETTLQSIPVPVGLILGGDSIPIMRNDTLRALELIPDGRLVELEGEKHIAHYTAPERLAGAIEELALT